MELGPKPSINASTEEKLSYLVDCGQAIVELLNKATPWVAREPEEIYNGTPRVAGAYFTSKMANWIKGKRILFKVESSLDQAVNVQCIGGVFDSRERVADVGPMHPCAANFNISIGPAWDDWHPFMGLRLTLLAAPPSGILRVWAVIQE